MPDRLRKLVNERDKSLARPHRLEPERLVLPDRGAARAKRICLDCRRDPDPKLHRAKWLEANPLPSDHNCRLLAADCVEWSWCTEGHVRHNMPSMTMCPACGGQLVEITA